MTDLSTRTIDRPPPTPAEIARSRREAPSKPATVTATELGEHLGLTRQRISALADTEHVIERLPNGRFNEDDCRLRYLRWLHDPARRVAKSAAASEFTAAKTRLIQLRIAEKQRDLIPVAEAVEITDRIVGIMLTHLSGMACPRAAAVTICKCAARSRKWCFRSGLRLQAKRTGWPIKLASRERTMLP